MGEWAMAVCDTCGMPVRVEFEGKKIVKVLAVCGHPAEPAEAEAEEVRADG